MCMYIRMYVQVREKPEACVTCLFCSWFVEVLQMYSRGALATSIKRDPVCVCMIESE